MEHKLYLLTKEDNIALKNLTQIPNKSICMDEINENIIEKYIDDGCAVFLSKNNFIPNIHFFDVFATTKLSIQINNISRNTRLRPLLLKYFMIFVEDFYKVKLDDINVPNCIELFFKKGDKKIKNKLSINFYFKEINKDCQKDFIDKWKSNKIISAFLECIETYHHGILILDKKKS